MKQFPLISTSSLEIVPWGSENKLRTTIDVIDSDYQVTINGDDEIGRRLFYNYTMYCV